MDVIEEISRIGIVPVVAIEDAQDAVPLAKALMQGGINCVEITFRTDAAEEAICRIRENCPQMLIGAGTVLNTEQVLRAKAAGAAFVVSPGFNPKIVDCCKKNNILILPGCSGPSDVEAAMEMGIETVKFFPAEASGGLEMIKAMSAPYTKVRFMPTGGINRNNLKQYLDFPRVIACGGSWMVKKELIEQKDFIGIQVLTEKAVASMLGFEVMHIGINTDGPKEAEKTAEELKNLFYFGTTDGCSSVFAGKTIEIVKSKGTGAHGHLAIGVNYLERAVFYLGKKGCSIKMDTAKYDEKSRMTAVYLDYEICGLAVHLLQK